MAKFKYRMQNILDVKYKLETQAKTAYATANLALQEEELKLQSIYDDIQEYENQIRGMSEKLLNIQELKRCNEAIEIKKLQAKDQEKAVKKAEREVELARIRLNEVMIERKTHEKLKEKAFEEFEVELEETEKKEIDELVSFRRSSGTMS